MDVVFFTVFLKLRECLFLKDAAFLLHIRESGTCKNPECLALLGHGLLAPPVMSLTA